MADVNCDFDLAVLGGGPAGTSCAIHAARQGGRVLLLERGKFPRHKVCGEFISPEAVALLESLAEAPDGLRSLLAQAPRIGHARLFVEDAVRQARIAPPAASVSRYELDAALWQAAIEAGAECRQNTAVASVGGDAPFLIQTSAGEFRANAVVNASGRWSNLTRTAGAESGEKWLGLKAHFREAHPPPMVDLYFFTGGYCGVQPITADSVNACAMVRADAAATLDEVFARHHGLWRRTRDWSQETETVSTSPLLFRAPTPVWDGMLQIGDAAGFIDPFVGDGIAMALLGGRMAAQTLVPLFRGRRPLAAAAEEYARRYRRELLPAFARAARLRRLMHGAKPFRAAALQLLRFPSVAERVVRATRTR